MAETYRTTLKLRRGYAEAWERNNPVLQEGEPGFALDTKVLKIGDGITPWLELKGIDSNDGNYDDIISELQGQLIGKPGSGQNSEIFNDSNNTASGDYSHAEGYENSATGYASHVEGKKNIASGEYQHVQGKYNIEDVENKYAHIVGGGTEGARKNIHTLDWNGNAWFAGNLKIGGTSPDDPNAKEVSGNDPAILMDDIFSGYDHFYTNIAQGRVNPEKPLEISTYDGSGQLTHPCVRYFPEGFGNHQFWMAASPYPYSALDLENPCVWYSDDGYEWSADGIPNPLDLPLMVNGKQASMNSDPHLLLRPDGVMEIWWRTNFWENSEEGLYTVIYRRTSTDGIHWTEKEELHRMLTNSADGIVCPVALYEDGVYKIWAVSDQECLRYYESATGADWRHIRDIDVSNPDYPEYKVWHFDVNHTAKGYEFVGCYNIPGDYTSHKYLYYAVSQDNITYSKRVMILTRGETGRFDERLVYRPTIVRMADRVRIYYGANNADNVWSIGLIEAPSAYLFNAVLISGARVGAIESGQEWLDGRVTALEAGGGGSDRPADEGVTVVRSFDESPWLPGYWDPNNGALTTYGNMHRTQLVELASLTVDGELPEITATSSVVSWPLVRFNYFDGNLRWIGFDVGATTDPSAGTQEPTRLRWPAGAVYVAISANTADKGAVTVSGVPEGEDSAGADHVIAVETLASGAVAAGTADAFETGVTMGMIRKYRLFLVAIGGVSNRNLNNWYMWIGGKSILRVNVVRGQQILYEFLDNAKTVMLAHSGASGNVGAPAGFLGGSNSYGQFAPGGYACCIYDMADVPDDEPVIIQPNGTDNIDVNWVIMGVTK